MVLIYEEEEQQSQLKRRPNATTSSAEKFASPAHAQHRRRRRATGRRGKAPIAAAPRTDTHVDARPTTPADARRASTRQRAWLTVQTRAVVLDEQTRFFSESARRSAKTVTKATNVRLAALKLEPVLWCVVSPSNFHPSIAVSLLCSRWHCFCTSRLLLGDRSIPNSFAFIVRCCSIDTLTHHCNCKTMACSTSRGSTRAISSSTVASFTPTTLTVGNNVSPVRRRRRRVATSIRQRRRLRRAAARDECSTTCR